MRFFITAAAALATFGASASAEPPKSAPKQPAAAPTDSQPRPAQIVLASADPVRTPAEASPAPVKRRIAPRITTCRCGDPQPTPEPDGE